MIIKTTVALAVMALLLITIPTVMANPPHIKIKPVTQSGQNSYSTDVPGVGHVTVYNCKTTSSGHLDCEYKAVPG
jgi:hypothetical protein